MLDFCIKISLDNFFISWDFNTLFGSDFFLVFINLLFLSIVFFSCLFKLFWFEFPFAELKDLLFHPQEHRITIPQIQKILDELNLKFCGFEEQKVISDFKSTNYILRDMYDLEKWKAYEENNPNTFLKMHQFWCQKHKSSKIDNLILVDD